MLHRYDSSSSDEDAVIVGEIQHGCIHEEECPICKGRDIDMFIPKCRHGFCCICFGQLLQYQQKNNLPNTCPTCRAGIGCVQLLRNADMDDVPYFPNVQITCVKKKDTVTCLTRQCYLRTEELRK